MKCGFLPGLLIGLAADYLGQSSVYKQFYTYPDTIEELKICSIFQELGIFVGFAIHMLLLISVFFLIKITDIVLIQIIPPIIMMFLMIMANVIADKCLKNK